MRLLFHLLISEEQSAFIKGRLISDNVILSYELLHQLRGKRTGKVGCCALKVNMSKACDRLNWSFIKVMLNKIGFLYFMVLTIMDCVTVVKYFVIINGTSHSNITPLQGIQQGDHISPYLFLICLEGLSAVLREAIQNHQLIGVKASQSGPGISHQIFMDCKASLIEVVSIKGVLCHYELI